MSHLKWNLGLVDDRLADARTKMSRQHWSTRVSTVSFGLAEFLRDLVKEQQVALNGKDRVIEQQKRTIEQLHARNNSLQNTIVRLENMGVPYS